MTRTDGPTTPPEPRGEVNLVPVARELMEVEEPMDIDAALAALARLWASSTHTQRGDIMVIGKVVHALKPEAVVDLRGLIPAGPEPVTPEEARDLAGHRVEGIHDCFLMNCRDLGDEVRHLLSALATSPEGGSDD